MNLDYMQRALELAREAARQQEVPIGAVIVRDGVIVGEGYNQPIMHTDPTLHAEIVAIRNAAKNIGNYRLLGCDVYVTLEPCPMCLGAMLYARVKNLYFGAYDKKLGAVSSVYQLLEAPEINHRLHAKGGFLEADCKQLLQDFFKSRR